MKKTLPDINQSAADLVSKVTGVPAPKGVLAGYLKRLAAKKKKAPKLRLL